MNPTSYRQQLRAMGVPQELIERAKIAGKPLSELEQPKESRFHQMNKTEALYAIELEWQVKEGKAMAWRFEPIKFRIARRTWYTPDFLVLLPDGKLLFVEVKGGGPIRDDSVVKFKTVREMYPWFQWQMIRRMKSGWIEPNI